MDDTDPFSRQDPDSANNPVSHLLSESKVPQLVYCADESPSPGTGQVKKSGFFRRWLATTSSLRPTGDSIKWGIHWYTPVSIVLLLLLGTASAITHHIFYSRLHNQTVGDDFRQRMTLWIGSGLAFLTKVTLTAALGISRTQWVWLTLQKKWFTLGMIDSLFGVTSDPSLFCNWKMLRKAKVATVMAIAMWTFPLAAILTPGTISVQTAARQNTVPCTVPSLLFGFDNSSTATTPAWGDNITVIDFWYWNVSTKVITGNVYLTPHLRLTAYTGTITPLPDLNPADSPSPTTLGTQCGSNCTYTVEFLGPTVVCDKFTAWKDTDWRNSAQYMNSKTFKSVMHPAADRGFLVGIQHTHSENHQRVVFECRSSTAYYTVKFVVQNRKFQDPVLKKFEIVNLTSFEPIPIYPNIAYLPNWGLFRTVYRIMKGEYGIQEWGTTESINTQLAREIFTNPSNVGMAIEKMTQRMLISMIAFDFHFNSRQSVLNIAAIQQTNCTTTESVPIYFYSPQPLLTVYGLAVACALAASVAGFIALGQNKMASTTTVSAIIRTTRNRTLDECIVGGDCLGGDVMSLGLKKLKLRFGALMTDKKGTAPFALGVKGEIFPIKRD